MSTLKAVNRKETRELYADAEKDLPTRARGAFRKIKWVVMIVTLGIYYMPCRGLRWDRGPGCRARPS